MKNMNFDDGKGQFLRIFAKMLNKNYGSEVMID